MIEVVNHSPNPTDPSSATYCASEPRLQPILADGALANPLEGIFSLVSGVPAGKTAFSSAQTPTVAVLPVA
jgi:hypothetical protein